MLTRRDLLHVPPALAGGSLLVPALSGCDAVRSLLPHDPRPPEGPTPDLRSDLDLLAPGPTADAIGVSLPFTVGMLGGCAGILPDHDGGGGGRDDGGDGGRDAPGTGPLQDNLVCSPLSALLALTMAGLGAGGTTRGQMQKVLGGEMEDLAAFATTMRSALEGVGEQQREQTGKDAPEPDVASLADALWIQKDLEVQQDFLDDLAQYFAAGMFSADLKDTQAREDARGDMNVYAKEHTDGLIEELVPQGALGKDSRLVLIDALHLKGAWIEPLDDRGTKTFTGASGETGDVPMVGTRTHGLYEDDHCQATQLTTAGHDLALVLVRPRHDLHAVLESWQEDDGAVLGDLLDAVLDEDSEERALTVDLSLPAFDLSSDLDLATVLRELGMTTALSQDADLTGITTQERLRITDVLQKAVITVDDQGMEAAAASAVIAGTTSGDAEPPTPLVFDVPFLFLACESSTRAPLVVGWVAEPSDADGD
jgi:serine protease inhibitor